MSYKYFNEIITNGNNNTEEEEKTFYFFNNLNSSKDYSLEDYNCITSEINDLYFLDRQIKKINLDSSNLIKGYDKKLIKFKTEIYPSQKLLNKKTKNEERFLENSNLK